jgi:hypothetical protein
MLVVKSYSSSSTNAATAAKATILASIQIGVGNMPCPENSSFGLKKQQSQPISMVLQECNARHRPP